MRDIYFIKASSFLAVTFLCVTAAFSTTAIAEEILECPKDEFWMECRAAQGDVLAVYMVARDSYDRAYAQVKEGQLADFTQALEMGRELVDQKEKNGARLLKMVHLQLSWGNHIDGDQALAWLKEDQDQRDLDYLPVLINRLAPGQSQ
ncbi:MAG TPA: hypothetical protein DEO41_04270 [Betaproteobacteria bacterium]|jgi:hypothetical protein|nr:hypothetical protein [Betaproteobacteria bacterium]